MIKQSSTNAIDEECCHISKQRMLQESSHLPLQPHPSVNPERIQDGEKQDTGPRQLKCKSKE